MRQDVVIIYVDRRLQNASYYKMSRSPLLQNAAIPITKCADNYKIPKTLLQNTWVITKCVVMTKCRRTLPSHLNSLQFLPGKSLGVFLFKTSLNLQQESRHQNSLSFTLRNTLKQEYLQICPPVRVATDPIVATSIQALGNKNRSTPTPFATQSLASFS